MRHDVDRQWIGAMMADDTELASEMLVDQPALADTLHEAFDDPFRSRRFPVASLLFAVVGPPQQVVGWRQVRRRINRKMVELLLNSGADPNIHSHHGRPLCWARERDLVERLVGAGGDIDLWHDNGGSPLNFSVWQHDPERMQIQLSLGADPNACDPVSGNSVLHILARTDRDGARAVDGFVKMLLAAGAEVSTKNHQGATPVDIAESRGDKALVALLGGAAAG
jgi:hypothetical protein